MAVQHQPALIFERTKQCYRVPDGPTAAGRGEEIGAPLPTGAAVPTEKLCAKRHFYEGGDHEVGEQRLGCRVSDRSPYHLPCNRLRG